MVAFIHTVSGQIYAPAALSQRKRPAVPIDWGTPVAQWLRCCATNRKVAGSIPAGVSGFFIDINSSNRNEYQEYLLGVKATGA